MGRPQISTTFPSPATPYGGSHVGDSGTILWTANGGEPGPTPTPTPTPSATPTVTPLSTPRPTPTPRVRPTPPPRPTTLSRLLH
ncbi:MAG: hypothetical protein DMG62_25020 [Acidobacteria bacterium]|nr:MAG: hypothetical protein DMG62_25020 [Acidobacteriota bacterium]